MDKVLFQDLKPFLHFCPYERSIEDVYAHTRPLCPKYLDGLKIANEAFIEYITLTLLVARV